MVNILLLHHLATYFCEWISQQTLYRQQQFRNGQCQRPIVLNDIDADITMTRHIGMDDFREKPNDRRTHRISTKITQIQLFPFPFATFMYAKVSRKWYYDVHEKFATLVRAASGPDNGGLPM